MKRNELRQLIKEEIAKQINSNKMKLISNELEIVLKELKNSMRKEGYNV